MKRTVLCTALLAVLAAATPFLCMVPPFAPAAAAVTAALPASPVPTAASPASPGAAPVPGEAGEQSNITSTPTPAPAAEAPPVPLYDEASGTVVEVPLRTYLVGAAACEMPPSWPEDAIRAQMVACHSYMLYQQEHGGAAQGAAALTVNSALCSGWTTAEVLKSRWGEEFDARWARLDSLAAEVENALLLYGGAPAAACYHAISTGHTEASQNVWVEALPYLQGVDSEWDRASEEYEVTVQYSSQQVYDALTAVLGSAPEGDPGTWVGSTEWDAAGYVQSIELGGRRYSGVQVRSALGLRSACFAIVWQNGQFTVSTRGYGHGVGLSQYGAYAMASGGAGWRSILAYYFPGTELTEG